MRGVSAVAPLLATRNDAIVLPAADVLLHLALIGMQFSKSLTPLLSPSHMLASDDVRKSVRESASVAEFLARAQAEGLAQGERPALWLDVAARLRNMLA